MSKQLRGRLLAPLAVFALLGLAACGGGSGDSESAGNSNSSDVKSGVATSDNSASDIVEAATADIPFKGPENSPKPEATAKIAVVTADAAASGSVRVANGVKSAGQVLGWDVTVFDGQGQASGQNSALQQAVSQKVDGIILSAFASETLSQGMTVAKNAGIPVVSVEADNPVGDGPTDVFAEPDSGSAAAGEMLGALVASDSDGKAKVATLATQEIAVTRNREKAFLDQIQKCDGCEVVKQDNYLLSSGLKEIPLKVKSMLAANPEIDYLFVDIGQFGALSVQAIEEAGSDTKVVSVDCNPDDLGNIKKGDIQLGCAAHALETAGFAAVASLNFGIAGEDSAGKAYVPTKLFTEDNLPSNDTWGGDFDAEQEYGELWDVN